MIDRLLNQSAAPMLAKMAQFHAARHNVLAENIVNISTPGYVQKDLDVEDFRGELKRRAAARRHGPVGRENFATVKAEQFEPQDTLVFHDGNNRSVEQMMSEQAKNALQHNLAVELLRKQFESFNTALRERIA